MMSQALLVGLLLVPLLGGVVAWLSERVHPHAPRRVAAVTLLLSLGLTALAWHEAPEGARWLAEVDLPWIAPLGVRFHLALDGLSLPLLGLNWAVGLLAVGASIGDVRVRVGMFHACLLWVLAGVAAVFLAMDLVLFYFAWELMLVPMYLLIGIWGHERRVYAAIKFFLFTQASGLLLLVSILGLHLAHRAATGVSTFDYEVLLGTPIDPDVATWLMLGFFAAFAVKVPVVPLHTWLADAHTQAPTGGSVVLAGVLLKTGAYGMMRFLVPLFPTAAMEWAPTFMTLGVVGILYGAWLAFAQTDAKRLVAYTSVSHLGFVVLAVFALNPIALQGALFEMVCHGLSTGGLFVVVGLLYERTGTRDLRRMGGLWAPMPRLSALTLMLALAALGLPGVGNFVAEVLCLFGAFPVAPGLTALAALGLVGAAVYALWFVQRTVHGSADGSAAGSAEAPGAAGSAAHAAAPPADLGPLETAMLGSTVLGLLVLGLVPQPLLDVSAGAIARLLAGGGL